MGVRSLGPEDPLEEGMTTHSSIPAQRIPRTEEPGGATFHRVAKNRTRLKRLSTRQARSARMPSSALASGSVSNRPPGGSICTSYTKVGTGSHPTS